MSAKQSDKITAAEADWGFTQDPKLMAAIDREAQRAASQWNLEADDLRQDFYLWLASPNQSGQSRWRGLEPGLVVHKLQDVIRTERKKAQRRGAVEVGLLEET